MSSRAVRKLQKLREQELQQKEEDESSDDEPVARPSKPKFNAFDLLNAAEDEEDEEEEAKEEEETQEKEEPRDAPSQPAASSKKKKNKKKKKASARSADTEASTPAETNEKDLDEIDKALKDLAVEKPGQGGGDERATGTAYTYDDSFPKMPEELLGVEPKFLNAINEMKKLFGNVVLENFDAEDAGTGNRRRGGREMIDLGRALTGRYCPATRGQSFAGVTLRRNALMQAKDEWPRAPSGGLGMEMAEKLPDGSILYRLVHNSSYQDVQRQFEMCVESMDPQRLIHLLQYNPYHLSTLLQVSDIAKHQGDHAVSADLLERALFNIGRSAHSSFNNRIKEGQGKLDFLHAENRELWLVGWRYIANLGMKGTWRTAYEWAKLLLSLNSDDPYCMKLLIDHLALRGREYAHFVELCTQTRLSKEWGPFPNIQCSLALAYLRLNKPQDCRQQLHLAMSRYPWVFCRIAQELDIQPMPKQIWGKIPPTDAHELLTELYISRAKDLWNTPEAVSLIVETADSLPDKEEPVEPPEITLNIARHVVLSDIPSVTTHLPSRFVSGRISASDPLPPYESEAHRQQSDPTPSYISQMPEGGRPQWLRALLDQINNGAIHFPRFQPDDNEEMGEEDILGLEEEIHASHPGPENQPLLRQWLLGQGTEALQTFLREHGVDRGNWSEVFDYAPLMEYVDALNSVQPDSTRDELLHGPIRDAMGDLVVTMLEDELEMLPDPS